MLSWYLQIVGILRWAIELGRIDIFHETLLLSQDQANPWVGQTEYMYHIFDYLKSHMNIGRIGYDPIYPYVDL